MLDDLLLLRQDAAEVPDVLDRRVANAGVAQGQPQLVLELPGAGLDDEQAFDALEDAGQGVDRERPQRDRTEETGLEPFAAAAPGPLPWPSGPACCRRRSTSRRRRSGRDRPAAPPLPSARTCSLRCTLWASRSGSDEEDRADQVAAVHLVAVDRPLRKTRLDHGVRAASTRPVIWPR